LYSIFNIIIYLNPTPPSLPSSISIDEEETFHLLLSLCRFFSPMSLAEGERVRFSPRESANFSPFGCFCCSDFPPTRLAYRSTIFFSFLLSILEYVRAHTNPHLARSLVIPSLPANIGFLSIPETQHFRLTADNRNTKPSLRRTLIP